MASIRAVALLLLIRTRTAGSATRDKGTAPIFARSAIVEMRESAIAHCNLALGKWHSWRCRRKEPPAGHSLGAVTCIAREFYRYGVKGRVQITAAPRRFGFFEQSGPPAAHQPPDGDKEYQDKGHRCQAHARLLRFSATVSTIDSCCGLMTSMSV